MIKKWIEKTFEFWKEFHNSRLLWTKKSVDCNILCCIFNYVPYPIVSAVPNTPHNYFDIISNVFISFSTLCKLTLFWFFNKYLETWLTISWSDVMSSSGVMHNLCLNVRDKILFLSFQSFFVIKLGYHSNNIKV
jgi:hypothetical protein